MWEVIISDIIPDGVRDVRAWAFRDLVEAHAVMEAVRDIREDERRRAEAERARG